ncbi:hypothetical protein N9543_02490 [Flavobacteriaceae bacterium]|nr:hypothetical protein [Flavobacteriaceae bacterium]
MSLVIKSYEVSEISVSVWMLDSNKAPNIAEAGLVAVFENV